MKRMANQMPGGRMAPLRKDGIHPTSRDQNARYRTRAHDEIDRMATELELSDEARDLSNVIFTVPPKRTFS